MKNIRNKSKVSKVRGVHKIINEMIIGLCRGTVRKEGEIDKGIIGDSFESNGTSAEELANKLVYTTAGRAAEAFEEMVDGMRMDIIMDMLSLIDNACPVFAVSVLQGMFYACSMELVAKELDNIAICEGYCEDSYEYFIDQFMQTDEIDWFLMERTLGEVS